MAQCILAALHAPDDDDGIPAMVGAMYLVDGLNNIAALKAAYVKAG